MTSPLRAMEIATEKLAEAQMWMAEAGRGARSVALSGALKTLGQDASHLRQKVEDLREAQSPVRSPLSSVAQGGQ